METTWNCSDTNEEIQKDFGGLITTEKDQYKYFLACNDRFSKYPAEEPFDKTNRPNFVEFLDEHVRIHGVPRKFWLDQARGL